VKSRSTVFKLLFTEPYTLDVGVSICWGQSTYEHILTHVGSLEHMDIF
jgi:hypothetical protein